MSQDILLLSDKARDWIAGTTGDFHAFVFGKEIGIQKNEIRDMILSDLVAEGTIESTGTKHGFYRRSTSECKRINWRTATGDWYPLWLPLGLGEMCGTRPKNIIIVAGGNNAGKTLFALQIAHRNLLQNGGMHPLVWYFNSEMGPDELRGRMVGDIERGIQGIDSREESWDGFEPFEKNSSFHSVIKPDGLNIVDYLEVSDKFYLVADMIQKIHAVLDKGICIICLQKSSDKDTGRGGEFTLEKPRLALALSYHFGVTVAKIVKCKNPLVTPNPQGQECDFKIVGGNSIHPEIGWRWTSAKERKNLNASYELYQAQKKGVGLYGNV